MEMIQESNKKDIKKSKATKNKIQKDDGEKSSTSSRRRSVSEESNTLDDLQSEKSNTEENLNSLIEDEYVNSLIEEEYVNSLNIIDEQISILKKISIKEIELSKDFNNNVTKKISNINKNMSAVTASYMSHIDKETGSYFKKKKNKFQKNNKKNNDKTNENSKKEYTYLEVVEFLNSPNTQYSQTEMLRIVCRFVKEHKDNNNPDILVEGNKKQFNLIGELKIFFNVIKEKMIEKGDLKKEDENNFPPKYIAYSDIMKYTKYLSKGKQLK